MDIPILLYHHILDNFPENEKSFCVTASQFERQMQYMHKKGYKSVSFDEIDKKNKNSFIITFDDGYENIYLNALPILKKYNFTATIFLVSECLGKTNTWDKENKINIHKILTKDQINEMLKAGFSIGSHSKTHSHMLSIKYPDVISEMKESKAQLEKVFNTLIQVFSYPFNEFNKQIKLAAKEAGYKYACAISSTGKSVTEDSYELRRIYIKGTDTMFDFKRKVSNWYLRYRGMVAH